MASSDRGQAAMQDKNKHQGQAQAQGGKQSQAGTQAHQFAGHDAHDAGKKGGHREGQNKQQVAEMGRKGGKH